MLHKRLFLIVLVTITSLLSAPVALAQDSEFPAGLVEFCEEHPEDQVRERATGEVFDCDEVLSPPFEVIEPGFEIVEEPFGVLDEEMENGEWQIQEVFGVTEMMRTVWFPGLQSNPARPDLWPTYPNIPNPLVPSFRVVNGNEVPDGLEYGEDLSVFCQQDVYCDFQVAARHYRLYTGDYNFPAIGESCYEAGTGRACAISVWNVGDVTAIFEDQNFDRGFTVTGRYWNGDVLHIAMNGLMSHAAANMLNMSTMASEEETLNRPGGRTNAGSNCSVPDACDEVDLRIVVVSGNEILWKARTVVGQTQ